MMAALNGVIQVSEAINYDITASFRKRFGSFTTRAQLKAQVEDFEQFSEFVLGTDIVTSGYLGPLQCGDRRRKNNWQWLLNGPV